MSRARRKKSTTRVTEPIPAHLRNPILGQRLYESIASPNPKEHYWEILNERREWFESRGWRIPDYYIWHGLPLPEGHPAAMTGG
jgi:hypothetical protein